MAQARPNSKSLEGQKAHLTLLELVSCQNGGAGKHPLSEPRAYPKPGRMVSVVQDIEKVNSKYFFVTTF